MPDKVTFYFNASTFQEFDGKNFTTVGVEAKTNFGLAGYLGLGCDFKDGSTGVFDIKYSQKYPGSNVLGFNGRIRTKLGENEHSTQYRVSPLSVSFPISEKVTGYVTPCGVLKRDYDENTSVFSVSTFGGVTVNFSENDSLSFELQGYDMQKMVVNSKEILNGENWSGNVIYSHKF